MSRGPVTSTPAGVGRRHIIIIMIRPHNIKRDAAVTWTVLFLWYQWRSVDLPKFSHETREAVGRGTTVCYCVVVVVINASSIRFRDDIPTGPPALYREADDGMFEKNNNNNNNKRANETNKRFTRWRFVPPKTGLLCKTKKKAPVHLFILNNTGVGYINSNLK